jgi:gliding motility-associated-like protein
MQKRRSKCLRFTVSLLTYVSYKHHNIYKKTFWCLFFCVSSFICKAQAPTITSFTPDTTCPGTSITITGTNFINATAVSFGGTAAASFTVNSSTSITALIGTGSTGTIKVTTPSGTATSAGTAIIGISATAYAYISNVDDGTVSVINTATNTVTATVAVGNGPDAVSASPDGNKVYVANYSDNSVSVINTATNTVIATVVVGNGPIGVEVSADNSKVYVANWNSNSVSVINTATNTVIATVAVGISPCGVSVSPDGSKVYVINFSSNNVSIINTATNTVIATVAAGNFPQDVCVSPDGSRIYVTNYNSNSVSVINTATNTIIATVPVGSEPYGVCVSPDGSKVYVANVDNGSVSVINTVTNIVTATVVVGNGPVGVDVSPDGTKVYVVNGTNGSDNTVNVINTATNTVIATILVGQAPFAAGNFIAMVATPCFLLPTITSFTPDITCSATSITITGTNFIGATAVSFGDTNAESFTVNSDTSITALIGAGSTGIIKVTTPSGIATSTDTIVIENPPTVSVADTLVKIDAGYSAVLNGSVVPDTGVIVSWSSNNGSSIYYDYIDSPYMAYSYPIGNTQYTLKAISTTSLGCSDSATIDVIVLDPISIPNAFSPNGDGVHDSWYIKRIEQYPNAEVDVFNRYGQLLYQSQGNYLERPWDGYYNGQSLPVGTYYYIINLNSGAPGDPGPLTGSISIIR